MIEQHIAAFVAAMGLPSAICGVLVWWFKREIERKDAEKEKAREEREKAKEERDNRIEELMLLNYRETRATNILAVATAKAVQRIPDAHCNGDMTSALEEAAAIQREEKDFLVNNGIKHIFGE